MKMKVLVCVTVATLLVAGGVAVSAVLDQLHGAQPTTFQIIVFGGTSGIAVAVGQKLFSLVRRVS